MLGFGAICELAICDYGVTAGPAPIVPVYGDPSFRESLRDPSRRIGMTPDGQSESRLGSSIVSPSRRIGRAIR
jgi:hypothetical protein